MLGPMATSDIMPSPSDLLCECHFDIGVSSLGGEYSSNEDYCIASAIDGGERLALTLADGIGSEPLGRAVSRLVCLSAQASLSSGKSVEEAFGAGLREIRSFLRETNSPRSGAALLVAKCSSGNVRLAFVGDCRAALIRDSALYWLNLPDKVPGTSRLTSAVGADMVTRPNVIEQDLAKGDILVFMTDGATDTLDSMAIVETVVSAPSALVAAKSLARNAREVGKDDATAVVARFH